MSALRALVVTPRPPWPLDDGGRIDLWQFATSLVGEFQVTLVTLCPPGPAPGIPEALRSLGVDVVFVPHRPPHLLSAVSNGTFGRWPYMLARYRSPALDATVARLVAERRPALALVNNLHLAPLVDVLGPVPMVLREQNVEYRWLERYAASASWPVGVYARFQALRMRHAESELCTRARLVLAIHDDEAHELRAIAPRARIEVVPVGVDFSRYRDPAPVDPPVVLLAASFSLPTNVDGARRFVERGWPRLRERVPGVRLRVAGKALPPDLARRVRELGAEAVGYVEDMTLEMARASALVVPIWVAAGARVRIVEAMAARLPVVSTSCGVEGLGLERDRHYLEADTPEEQAGALERILKDGDRGRAMAKAAEAMARPVFSIETVARRTCRLCVDVARGAVPSAAPDS